MEFVYIQVNETQVCICTGHFKHHYGGSFKKIYFLMDIYHKESQSCAVLPLFAQGGRGMTSLVIGYRTTIKSVIS